MATAKQQQQQQPESKEPTARKGWQQNGPDQADTARTDGQSQEVSSGALISGWSSSGNTTTTTSNLPPPLRVSPSRWHGIGGNDNRDRMLQIRYCFTLRLHSEFRISIVSVSSESLLFFLLFFLPPILGFKLAFVSSKYLSSGWQAGGNGNHRIAMRATLRLK